MLTKIYNVFIVKNPFNSDSEWIFVAFEMFWDQFHEGICYLTGLLIESKWTNNGPIKDMVII